MEKLLNHLKGKFLAGLFVVVPVGITIFISSSFSTSLTASSGPIWTASSLP
ncbi:hypothetical protein [Geotalea toluenoxydans]|uniref:hypothetical protein n=1 Tax=Geotalea toluenoxydans TaxID=421624 RepID=UPI000B18F29D|nr:hypothetical protein [Geotalea toluenoxydans]